MKSRNKKLWAIIAIILAAGIWGINYPISKIGLQFYSPLWFFVLKYTFATLLFALLFKRRNQKIPRIHHIKIALESWLSLSCSIVISYYALRHVRGIDAAIIYSLAPMALYWFSVTILKERFRLQPLIGTIVALVGALIVVFNSTQTSQSSNTFAIIGMILLTVSILCDVLGTIFIKPYLKKYDANTLALYRFIYALVPIIILALWTEPLPRFHVEPLAIFSLLYGSLICVLIGFPLYYFGLKKLEGEDVGVLFYIEPILGVFSSFIILHEQPSAYFGAGAFLVLLGILVAEVHVKKHVFSHISRLHHH